jgi:hypothetical protein
VGRCGQMYVTQDRDQWLALVNTVMVAEEVGSFLTS